MIELKIKPAFKALLPPLSDSELVALEASIAAEGCRNSLVVWRGTIVDGHNRYAICQKLGVPFKTIEREFRDELEAKLWIRQNAIADGRNFSAYGKFKVISGQMEDQRHQAKLNQKLGGAAGGSKQKQLFPTLGKPVDVEKAIAEAIGQSHGTVAKMQYIAKHATEKIETQLYHQLISVNRAYLDLKDSRKLHARNRARKAKAIVGDNDKRIIVGDFSKMEKEVSDGSVSLIFTDPPYDQASLDLFPKLASFAEAKLCEGGSLLCYIGHLQLSTALVSLSEKLRYWWTICCLHSGSNSLMKKYGIRFGWKPILWFVKGTRHDVSNIVSDVVSGGKEKADHDWQQSLAEASYWIEQLCPKDGIVVDPFLGSGTTALACEQLKRRWVGFEIDPETAAVSSKRIKGK